MKNEVDNEDVVVRGEEFIDCIAEGVRFDLAQFACVKFIGEMRSFWGRYFIHREVWEDCHLSFSFEHHTLGTRDSDSVVALLVGRLIPMPIGGGATLNIEC